MWSFELKKFSSGFHGHEKIWFFYIVGKPPSTPKISHGNFRDLHTLASISIFTRFLKIKIKNTFTVAPTAVTLEWLQ